MYANSVLGIIREKTGETMFQTGVEVPKEGGRGRGGERGGQERKIMHISWPYISAHNPSITHQMFTTVKML